MNAVSVRFWIAVIAGCLLTSISAVTQVSPSTTKASHVRITEGPEMERVDPDFAIIRWTSNNPGGSPEHLAVVHYGTTPKELSQTAKSPIRLNPSHPYTVFRVRMDDLKPRTKYFYKVDSMEANGKSDGVTSGVKQFTTR